MPAAAASPCSPNSLLFPRSLQVGRGWARGGGVVTRLRRITGAAIAPRQGAGGVVRRAGRGAGRHAQPSPTPRQPNSQFPQAGKGFWVGPALGQRALQGVVLEGAAGRRGGGSESGRRSAAATPAVHAAARRACFCRRQRFALPRACCRAAVHAELQPPPRSSQDCQVGEGSVHAPHRWKSPCSRPSACEQRLVSLHSLHPSPGKQGTHTRPPTQQATMGHPSTTRVCAVLHAGVLTIQQLPPEFDGRDRPAAAAVT